MRKTESTSDFKVRDAASYDSLTAEFDRFTQRLSRPLAERMVALANLQPVDRILDIVEGDLAFQSYSGRQGTLGSLVIQGRVTEVLDLEALTAMAAESDGLRSGPSIARSQL